MAMETRSVLSPATTSGRRHPPAGDGDDMGALEVALLRRSLSKVHARNERCGRCDRTLLLGERVYEYSSGALRCALCRGRERQAPADSHLVHGPEFGHSIRVLDRRSVSAASAARPA